MIVSMADYGVGNLHSIKKALEINGAEVVTVTDMNELLDAECIVFPGVGAFDKTMERLLPLRKEICAKLEKGTPALGICIGMQILFRSSQEGRSEGLALFDGDVIKLDAEQIPHMGWNQVDSDDPLMDGISDRYFYFANSYRGNPSEDIVRGTTEYEGKRFPSFFRKNNTYGTQFHPEKSSESGMRFLKNFISFAEDSL